MRHHYDKLTVARVYLELKALIQGNEGKAPKTGDGDLRDRLAKRFHISGRSLDRHVKMLKAPASAQELYRKGMLSDSVMVALAALTADQQRAVLAEVKTADDAKEKNLAAKVAIGKFRKANKEARDNAKAAKAAKATGKASENRDAEVESENAAEPETADLGADAVQGGDDSGGPAELAGDVDGDHEEQADSDEAVETSENEADEDHDSTGTYHWVLHELPDTFDTLVEQADYIVGKVMDPDAAVVALQRIVDSALTLIEDEKAKAEALAGVTE